MRILSVNVGRAVDADWAGNLRRTAIDKRKIEGRIAVRENGLAGDERADVANHGHPDQAVYAYAREDYDWWEPIMGRDLRDGQFGENLTTSGADVTGAVLGERWRVGTAVLEVTAPRIPCVVFRNWLDERGWVKRFTDANRTGAYFRVVEQGELGAGDEIEVLYRPSNGVTIAESFRAYHGDRDLMLRILDLPGHSDKWDRIAERVLGDRSGVVAT
ncbi:MOSC domain-containing protein [Microbispora hainanensis]|jgi:MOSC domain-containing protein YiiM|uniref:MOSC domain-containing protein n=1 Tax=Microbispora hainanensis TaxID=568844 RepID=A0ABZ1SQZ0_9ACTN|nr:MULTISPECIES: MOSC domain-containing protein [Microbispora]NJP28205.1 MOSC domain-containing protein [Microbispora sp. CL1-1]TQS09380.1 MOSC domain-containing protein [Microbispora sp. SCL1-1]